jgi:hypothetical protein
MEMQVPGLAVVPFQFRPCPRADKQCVDLAGLLREERGVAARVLEASGVTLDAVRERIGALTGPGQEPPHGHITFTARAKKGFELALREATRLGQQIGTGHLLLGLTGQADCTAARVLGALGLDVGVFRGRVIAETASRPEGQEYPPLLGPRGRPRRVAISDPVRALLDSIDDRLSAIERHLGMNPGAPENVIPPS